MLEILFKLYYEAHLNYQSLELELTHEKIADWQLTIIHGDSDTTIFHSNSTCLTDLAVQGYTALKEWLDKKNCDGADTFLLGAGIF